MRCCLESVLEVCPVADVAPLLPKVAPVVVIVGTWHASPSGGEPTMVVVERRETGRSMDLILLKGLCR